MANGDGSVLGAYHKRTNHSYASVRSSPGYLDFDNQPRPFKVYPDLEPVPLPTDFPGSQRLALDAIRGDASQPAIAFDVARLAYLLHLSAGVLRRRTYPGGEILFRAAACTGALYHIDAYVVSAAIDDLDAGVYHFGPHDFALRRLRHGDHRAHVANATGDEPHVAEATALLILTSTFWRNAWKYRTRTYRHAFWDAGTLLANLLGTAAAVGLAAHVATAFADDAITRLLDLDPAREAPLAVIALGTHPDALPAAPPVPVLGYATLPLSAEEIDYPLVRDAHAASSLLTPDEARAWRERLGCPPDSTPPGSPIPLVPMSASRVPEPIDAVILRRGSSRHFPRTPITLEALATILHTASAPVALDVHAPSRCYVIANAVDGIDPGAYVVTGDGSGIELLRSGDFRGDAGYLGLGQELPARAAACLYWLVDLAHVFATLGDRGYRVAQLEAAIAGGRTYLAAYALGLGATGLTFFDDDVTQFFSPHAKGKSVMFHMAVGSAGRPRAAPREQGTREQGR